MIRLSIIIPAYNEERRIAKTLQDYLTFFQDKQTEIIVVLNGCRDETKTIVEQYQKKFPQILKYIDIWEAIGKGGAIKEGFKIAQGELIGFVDADCATDAKEYQKLINNIGDNDGIIASRWLADSIVINRSFFRRCASKCFAIVVQLIFNMPFSDTQCGAKVFKRQPLLAILPKLRENGMVFDVELLYRLFLKKYQIKEFASTWVDQPGSVALSNSQLFLAKGFQMLNKLFKIKKYGKKSNL